MANLRAIPGPSDRAKADEAIGRFAEQHAKDVLVDTDVPAALRGRGVANALARWAVETAERDGLRVVAACPFVRAYMQRHAKSHGFDSQLTH